MPAAPSIMHLHLRYRLWIAEMNSDIDVLRIFNDYLVEMQTKKNVQEVIKGLDHFKKEFVSLRKEIDELKHEMHLIKMKLAAAARESNPLNDISSTADVHNDLRKRYTAFRKTFTTVKKEFGLFEGKWLN